MLEPSGKGVRKYPGARAQKDPEKCPFMTGIQYYCGCVE